MRISRILGLAAVAAMALVVLSGARSAAAKVTVLCAANEETCSEENTYFSPTSLQGYFADPGVPETYAKLEMSGLFTVSCGAGKFTSELSKSEGPLVGEVYKWFFFSCSGGGCTLETGAGEHPGYSSKVEATGGGNGTLMVTSPRLIASCSTPNFKITCTYDAGSMEFSVEGGTFENWGYISSAATLTRNNAKSTPGCTATAKFVSRYEINEPGLVFVTYG